MIMQRWFGPAETLTKWIGVLTVLIAALSFLWPWFGTMVNVATAWRFGVTGYVYYEIDENKSVTNDGRLFLLRSGDAKFAALAVGDKLQAVDDVNFRESARRDSRALFRLRSGDCVVLLNKDKEMEVLQNAQSGGWLKVATAACGLFR